MKNGDLTHVLDHEPYSALVASGLSIGNSGK
jgi:hypothetical protein